MSAREDYPLLAWLEGTEPWPEGWSADLDPSIADSLTGIFDHVDALRSVVEAAIVWRQCERAMHGNTAARDEIERLRAEVERLRAENATLRRNEWRLIWGLCTKCGKDRDQEARRG